MQADRSTRSLLLCVRVAGARPMTACLGVTTALLAAADCGVSLSSLRRVVSPSSLARPDVRFRIVIVLGGGMRWCDSIENRGRFCLQRSKACDDLEGSRNSNSTKRHSNGLVRGLAGLNDRVFEEICQGFPPSREGWTQPRPTRHERSHLKTVVIARK